MSEAIGAHEDGRPGATIDDPAMRALRDELARISTRLTPEIEPATVYRVHPDAAAPKPDEHP